MTSSRYFVSKPSRSKMLDRHKDLAAYLVAHPDLTPLLKIHKKDSIGFFADVGNAVKNERFDFPFNGEAFYEILETRSTSSWALPVTLFAPMG